MKTIKKNQILRMSLISMLLLLVTQLSAKEYYSISGKVLNNRTESIKGAQVKLVNPVTFEKIAESKCKENGEFFINDVPEGEYNLIIKKDGVYRAKVKRIIIDGNGNYLVKNTFENDSTKVINDFIAVY